LSASETPGIKRSDHIRVFSLVASGWY